MLAGRPASVSGTIEAEIGRPLPSSICRPTGRDRRSKCSWRAARFTWMQTWLAAQGVRQSRGVTLYMSCCGVEVMLYQHSGQEDILVLLPWSDGAGPSLKDCRLLCQSGCVARRSFREPDVPGVSGPSAPDGVGGARPSGLSTCVWPSDSAARDLSRPPLCQTMFVLDNHTGSRNWRYPGLPEVNRTADESWRV